MFSIVLSDPQDVKNPPLGLDFIFLYMENNFLKKSYDCLTAHSV